MKIKQSLRLFQVIKRLDTKLNLNGVARERVDEAQFLGVIIDSKLCWKPHIEYIKSKVSKFIDIPYKTRDLLNKDRIYMICCSLVLTFNIFLYIFN